MSILPIKRALISVSNKAGIVEFSRNLTELGVEILSTGGTSLALKEANIPHRQVDEVTGMAEMLGGRVKTLHPAIHGGILGKRDQHEQEAKAHGIEWIDLVVVNFYPFAETIAAHSGQWETVVESIDIGGPTMVRAAAKNFNWVTIATDPADYDQIIHGIRFHQGIELATRIALAEKAFGLTAYYDSLIHQYFMSQSTIAEKFPTTMTVPIKKYGELRYGENPHQLASAYQFPLQHGILSAKQHQGKPLSYNNIVDAESAISCVQEFNEPACVIVKHANPCGVGSADTIEQAYEKAHAADAMSAFGGIIALNRECTKAIAEKIAAIFMEVVIAPSFTEEALSVFGAKSNLRLLSSDKIETSLEMRFITGGVLMQERDRDNEKLNWQVVTKSKPSESTLKSLQFAWKVVKHIKSNAILLSKNEATVGVGAGQVSRIDAVNLAIQKANGNAADCVLASDAFFPFRDSIDRIAESGIKTIVQPGGSLRDEEVIAACDEHGIAMVFTGQRCFRH